mmetsp:Transcript_72526/g.175021  ORF Transcript_72526/g.175021 Transcript_72526/m.175021 type:complete len:308 (+) Transcript_72526:178-1101(+)
MSSRAAAAIRFASFAADCALSFSAFAALFTALASLFASSSKLRCFSFSAMAPALSPSFRVLRSACLHSMSHSLLLYVLLWRPASAALLACFAATCAAAAFAASAASAEATAACESCLIGGKGCFANSRASLAFSFCLFRAALSLARCAWSFWCWRFAAVLQSFASASSRGSYTASSSSAYSPSSATTSLSACIGQAGLTTPGLQLGLSAITSLFACIGQAGLTSPGLQGASVGIAPVAAGGAASVAAGGVASVAAGDWLRLTSSLTSDLIFLTSSAFLHWHMASGQFLAGQFSSHHALSTDEPSAAE